MSQQPEQEELRWRRWVVLGVLGGVGMIVAITHAVLNGDKDRVLNGHRELAALETRTLTEMVSLQIGALNVLVDGLTSRVDGELSRGDLNLLVQRQPLLRSASLLDVAGGVLLSSNPANEGLWLDVSGFFPSTDAPIDYFRMGSAWVGKDIGRGRPAPKGLPGEAHATGGHFFLALREIPRADRAPVRLLLAVDTGRMQQVFEDWLHLKGGRAAIHRFDGVRLFSDVPDAKNAWAQKPTQDGVLKMLAVRDYGELVLDAPDGDTRFVTYHASAEFPFFSVVTYSQSDLLKDWHHNRTRVWLLVLSVVAVALLALLALYRRWESAALLRRQQMQQLRLFAAVYTHSVEAITITDTNANIIAVNDAHARLTGYTPAEVVGGNPSLWGSDQHGVEFFRAMWTDLKVRKAWSGEIWNRRKNGQVGAERMNIFAVPNEHGQAIYYVAMSHGHHRGQKSPAQFAKNCVL